MEELKIKMPSSPGNIQVECEDDAIGVHTSIAFHTSLKRLVETLQLPVDICSKLDHSGDYCGEAKPFEVLIMSKGIAAVIEWVIFLSVHVCVVAWENPSNGAVV